MVVDLYEPQYLALIVFGGFVALSFVVYAFSAFGIQEKSYEQAVAEQRARLEKEQQHQRELKRQKRKPFFEKKKREREKPESSPGVIQQAVVQAVPSYVEEQALPPPPSPSREEKVKPEKVKPAPKKLKQAKPPKQVVVEENIEDNQAPVEEAIPPPKDSQATKSKPPKVEEELVQKQSASVAAAAPPTQAAPFRQEQASPAKAKSKTKTTSGDGDTSVLRGKSLISAVKSAPLKDSEIQQLIEILLNRQGGSASADDWVKANQRNDPVSALKKQLQEKEQALHNEMLLAQSASQKVKDLRNELNQQREHSASNEAQYKLKLETQAREIQAFNVRMQQSHESHAHETQALQARVKQAQALLEESSVEVVNQLREENSRLQSEANHAAQQKEQLMGAELARLQAELQKIKSKLSTTEAQMRQGEEVRHSLETQLNQYNQQRNQFDADQRESESAISKRLSEVSEELRSAEAHNQSLAKAVETANGETEKVKGQLADYCRMDGDRANTLQTVQAKLKESECRCQNLEGQVRAVEVELAEREKQKALAHQELEALRKEKDSLQVMLQMREKRSEAEGQESPPRANGDVDHTDSAQKEDSILLKEHDNILADKTKTIAGLEEQLNSSRTELKELQAVIEQQKQRNNNLREKNRKLMDVVSAAEKSSAENASLVVKAAKEESISAIAQEQAAIKKVLERLFPSVSAESSLGHKEWLGKFEEQAAQVLGNQSSTNSQVDEYALKINTLEAEKDQLSSQCQHYQSVLADTEGMVNKLQKSVESEEERYKGRILSLEAEKQQLRTQCQQLEDKATAQDAALTESSENRRRLARLEGENGELARRAESAEKRLTGVVEEMEREKATLAAQCQHYQVVLRETEGILNKLQSSVESEEVKWEEKLKQTSSNLEEAKDEVNTLQQELDVLTSNTSKRSAQYEIPHMTSDENSRLASELEEAQATIDMLRQDQESAASSYEATSQELEELKKQLHQLKAQLEAANQRAEQSNDMVEENAETKSKLSASEANVKKLEAELRQAMSSLSELESRSAASANNQAEVESLQRQLEEAKGQLKSAESAAQEAQKEVVLLKENLRATSNATSEKVSDGDQQAKAAITESQAALAKAEEKVAAQQKEIASLGESLKKEKGLTQDLGKAAAKLQAMLKKTQSALNVEKETVAKLKVQNGAKEEAKQVDGTGV